MSWRKRIKEAVLGLLYPDIPRCPACGAEQAVGFCPVCEKRLDASSALPSSECLSAYKYEGIPEKLVKDLKFHDKRWLAPHMAQKMAHLLENVDFDIITAVPLHKKRLRERGYNQSELLARSICPGKYMRLLQRTRATARQTDLSGAERAENVRGAFATVPHAEVLGRKVVIVDDVYTTGSTLAACEDVLWQMGAKDVIKLTFTRV